MSENRLDSQKSGGNATPLNRTDFHPTLHQFSQQIGTYTAISIDVVGSKYKLQDETTRVCGIFYE